MLTIAGKKQTRVFVLHTHNLPINLIGYPGKEVIRSRGVVKTFFNSSFAVIFQSRTLFVHFAPNGGTKMTT